MPATNETQLQYHQRRLETLKQARLPVEAEWRDLAEHVEPPRLRLNIEKVNERGTRKKIIDSTGTFAWRTLASGMHSGLTSPARPWFALSTIDPDLKEFGPVKTWLADVQTIMRDTFRRSNIYEAFHYGYGDMGLFGQEGGLLLEDRYSTVRMQKMTHGTFWIARDEQGRADTLYHCVRWPVERIVRRFGYRNCSTTIQNHWDNSRYDEKFTIWHAVEPRKDRDPRKIDRRNKPILSNYWEDGAGSKGGKLLEESGYDDNPIIAPPWELIADDWYGVGPAAIALSDIKMLQIEQQRKIEGIDKMVRPPMNAPTSMMNAKASLLPGAVNYVDDPTGKGFRPAMEVNLNLQYLLEDVQEVKQRVNTTFYADLFLMLTNMEGIQPRNQFEIAERKEEKLLALGPVLENVYAGKLQPAIDRTFNILAKSGKLPPPPREIRGQHLSVEYISILAQAQKAVATGSVERLWAFAGNIAGMLPDVLDKLDADQTIDEYADMIGAPPSIVKTDDDVAKARQARAQAQQQQANIANAAAAAPAALQGAQAAKVLTEAAQLPGAAATLNRLGLN